jgi:hypothetical protein
MGSREIAQEFCNKASCRKLKELQNLGSSAALIFPRLAQDLLVLASMEVRR